MGSNPILAAIHRRGRRGVAAGDPADASGIAPARRLPDDLIRVRARAGEPRSSPQNPARLQSLTTIQSLTTLHLQTTLQSLARLQNLTNWTRAPRPG
jgi:hypothetical protein